MKKIYMLSFNENNKPQKLIFKKNIPENIRRGYGKDATEKVIVKELNNQNLQKHPILAKFGINTKRTYVSGLDSVPFGADKSMSIENIAKNEEKVKANNITFSDKESNKNLKRKVSDETKTIIVAGATGAATGAVSDAIKGSANYGLKAVVKGGKRIFRIVRI